MSDDLYNMLLGFMPDEEEVRETYVRAPFGWPGGKDLSKSHILRSLPYRKSYIEHCGGSGIIITNRVKSPLDVFNDRDSGVTSFYRCIRDADKLQQLKTLLDSTVHSREEFIFCKKSWRQPDLSDVERAFRWYYVTRLSFSQQRRNFGRATSGAAQQPQMIHNSLDLFPALHARWKQIQVENLDLFQSIKDFDNEDAVHYIDPSYLGCATGIYEHELTEADHQKLVERIHDGKGYFAISGYAHPIYDQLKWDKRLTWKVQVTAQAKAFTDTNHQLHRQNDSETKYAEEVLWIKDHSK